MRPDAEQLIRRTLAAFESGDADTFAECFDPEGELLLPRNLIEGGSYRGHAGIKRAVSDAYETWRGFEFRIDTIDATENGVVVQAHVTNVARGDGPTVEYQTIYGGRVGERGITHFRPYETRADALGALRAVGES